MANSSIFLLALLFLSQTLLIQACHWYHTTCSCSDPQRHWAPSVSLRIEAGPDYSCEGRGTCHIRHCTTLWLIHGCPQTCSNGRETLINKQSSDVELRQYGDFSMFYSDGNDSCLSDFLGTTEDGSRRIYATIVVPSGNVGKVHVEQQLAYTSRWIPVGGTQALPESTFRQVICD